MCKTQGFDPTTTAVKQRKGELHQMLEAATRALLGPVQAQQQQLKESRSVQGARGGGKQAPQQQAPLSLPSLGGNQDLRHTIGVPNVMHGLVSIRGRGGKGQNSNGTETPFGPCFNLPFFPTRSRFYSHRRAPTTRLSRAATTTTRPPRPPGPTWAARRPS